MFYKAEIDILSELIFIIQKKMKYKYKIAIEIETNKPIPQRALDEEVETLQNEFAGSDRYEVASVTVYQEE